PLTSTLTFGGIAMGCLPIRDIKSFLPNVAEQFPANVLLPRLHTGHHALGSREHCDTHSSANTGDVCRANISAKAGTADPLHTFNDALFALILQLNFDGSFGGLPFDGKIVDVTFFLEDRGDALFDL